MSQPAKGSLNGSTNGAAEPTETSSLLSKSTPKLVDVPGPEANGLVVGKGSVGRDVEAGDSGDAENEENSPLFQGNPEMARRMHLLFPAVAIGVSIGDLFYM